MPVLKVLLVTASLLLGALSAPAAAAPPSTERITIDETVDDVFLAEACGLKQVTSRITGTVTLRGFDRSTGTVQLTTLNVLVTAQAGSKVVRFRDVGSDSTRVLRDGTVVLSLRGQAPFQFTGVLKIDLTTGDVLLETPPRRTQAQAARLCAALQP